MANLLVNAHRLHLNYGMIDKLIVLRMNKKFMDRICVKKAISVMYFENVESNKRAKV